MSQPAPLTIHILIVVPDLRLYKLIKEHVLVLGPNYQDVLVQGHVVLDDKNHPAADIRWSTRMALAELGLVDPIDVGFKAPAQVTLGWPEEPVA